MLLEFIMFCFKLGFLIGIVGLLMVVLYYVLAYTTKFLMMLLVNFIMLVVDITATLHNKLK
jgi:hypothetical protein